MNYSTKQLYKLNKKEIDREAKLLLHLDYSLVEKELQSFPLRKIREKSKTNLYTLSKALQRVENMVHYTFKCRVCDALSDNRGPNNNVLRVQNLLCSRCFYSLKTRFILSFKIKYQRNLLRWKKRCECKADNLIWLCKKHKSFNLPTEIVNKEADKMERVRRIVVDKEWAMWLSSYRLEFQRNPKGRPKSRSL